MTYIWTAMLMLNFLKTLQKTVAHLEQPWLVSHSGVISHLLYKQLLNACQPRFDTQQYNTVLTCFPLPYR